jgi:3-deoxy-D-manno-octulosonic-acid transferase
LHPARPQRAVRRCPHHPRRRDNSNKKAPIVTLEPVARAVSRAMPLRLKRALFGALSWLSERRSTGRPPHHEAAAGAPIDALRAPLMIFASTIGEVNAIEPFTRRLLETMGQPPLVLVTDRDTYAEAYRNKYPQAQVLQCGGRAAPVLAAMRAAPPALLLVAEIPCLPHDAPCRLPYAMLHGARAVGTPVVLVNGWLYGYTPTSGLDRVERLLFQREYARSFDLALVQTERVRATLLAAGAEAARVEVTGNIKFDAWSEMPQARPTPLIAALAARGSAPVIVCGSVTEPEDHAALIEAFRSTLPQHPDGLLVLAPRHPENQPRMQALQALLEGSGLRWRRRSEHPPEEAVRTQVLVLDTMGELQGCYASATLAFVGRDHNVLEPLAFGKPVFVGPGWEPTYPSYPVYRQLMDATALQAVDALADLGTAWCDWLARPDTDRREAAERARALLQRAGGASSRCLVAIERHAPARVCSCPAPAPRCCGRWPSATSGWRSAWRHRWCWRGC